MKVYVVYEYTVIEYEGHTQNMGVFSSVEKAEAAIKEYEEISKCWNGHFEYNYEEFELDMIWEVVKEEEDE
jgi:hypothetical protein